MRQKTLRAFSLILIFTLCLCFFSACSGNRITSSVNENIDLVEANPEPVNNEGKDMMYYAKTLLSEENFLGIIGEICPAYGGIYIDGQTINHETGVIKSSLYFMDKSGEIKGVNSDWIGESVIGFMYPVEGGGLWLIKQANIDKDNVEYELGSFKNGEYSSLFRLGTEDSMYIQDLCAAKGRIFISRSDSMDKGIIEAYLPNGEKDFEVNVGVPIFSLVGDGNSLYIANWDVSRTLKLRSLNPETGDIKEIASFESGNLIACSGEKLYIGDTTGLVEYDTASKNLRRLFRWSESGLIGNLASVWPQENGDFIVLSDSVLKLMYLDVKQEYKQVTLAVNAKSSAFSQLAFDFNEENTEYKVVIKDYGAYSDPQLMLNTDIISGKAPDLIDASGFSGDIIKPGAMRDLMEYIETDPDIHEEALVQGALNAMKTEDGELLAIAPQFYVFTMLCRDGAVEAGSFEGVESALNKLGSPEEAFAGTLSQNNFFNLAFCCGNADKYSHGDISAIIEYASKLPIEEDHMKEIENLQNGKQHAMPTPISAATYLFYNAIEFLGCESFKEMSLLGLPFRNGTGVLIPEYYFAIPANAANTDGAWAFLKYTVMTHGVQENITSMHNFCLFKDLYENYKGATEKFVRDWYEQEYDTIGYVVTDDDIKHCLELTDKMIDGLNGVFDNNAKVFEIVNDACGAYFAGQKSLDATADEIMSRLGIYFSEQG